MGAGLENLKVRLREGGGPRLIDKRRRHKASNGLGRIEMAEISLGSGVTCPHYELGQPRHENTDEGQMAVFKFKLWMVRTPTCRIDPAKPTNCDTDCNEHDLRKAHCCSMDGQYVLIIISLPNIRCNLTSSNTHQSSTIASYLH